MLCVYDIGPLLQSLASWLVSGAGVYKRLRGPVRSALVFNYFSLSATLLTPAGWVWCYTITIIYSQHSKQYNLTDEVFYIPNCNSCNGDCLFSLVVFTKIELGLCRDLPWWLHKIIIKISWDFRISLALAVIELSWILFIHHVMHQTCCPMLAWVHLCFDGSVIEL